MYGSALAYIAAFEAKNKVTMWTRQKEKADEINKTHINSTCYNAFLGEEVSASTDIKESLESADIIISALPVQSFKDVILPHISSIKPKVPFVSCSKGLIASERKLISQYMTEITNDQINYCVLSGPSFAEEMMNNQPTLVVVASKCKDTSIMVQKALSNKYFRIYTQGDVVGVELAGALKNVIAISCGIVEGGGFGLNTRTALLARGTKEMQSFSIMMGAKPETLFGLTGIGDLMLTAFGKLSRNRTFGFRLASGEKKEDILASQKGTVEGYATINVVLDIAKEHGIELPIIRFVSNPKI